MALDIKPVASAELAEEYAYTASLADTRRQQVQARGDQSEARAWASVAEYCRDMARTRARDDDQFKFQRDQFRHRREIPMSSAGMDAIVRAEWGDRPEGEPPKWQQAIIELAMGYLSPMQRVCFELVVGGRLPARDVAEALQTDERDVRKHVFRAKRRLARDVAPRVSEIFKRGWQ